MMPLPCSSLNLSNRSMSPSMSPSARNMPVTCSSSFRSSSLSSSRSPVTCSLNSLAGRKSTYTGCSNFRSRFFSTKSTYFSTWASHFDGCGGPAGPLSRPTTRTPATDPALTTTSASTTSGQRQARQRDGGGSGGINASSSSA